MERTAALNRRRLVHRARGLAVDQRGQRAARLGHAHHLDEHRRRLSTGNTVTFTYTAATGGLTNGAVTFDVPTGWSAPSTTGSAAGYTTSSAGTVSVAGRTVTVGSLTLGGGGTVTITYGSTASGGSGADAPTVSGAQTWSAQQKSTSGGTLTNLATSPSITVQDTTAPTFSSANVNDTTLTITLNEALDGSSTPAGSAFTVVRNGTGMAAPTNVVVSGTTVTLTLAASVHYGDTVTVAYTQPGTGRIKDIAGNDAATFGAQAVTNATPSLPPDVPALVSPVDGSTVATLTPALSATFSDVDTNNTGQLTFRLCTTSNCSSPIGGTFSSSAGIANGADGSAIVPGGRITSDGTYYWQAKATDNTSAVSAFSASHSFTVDTTAPLLQTAAVNGTSLTLTYDEGSTPAPCRRRSPTACTSTAARPSRPRTSASPARPSRSRSQSEPSTTAIASRSTTPPAERRCRTCPATTSRT